MMQEFIFAFAGGLLLGVAAVGYLYTNGRIAGVSGLIAQVLNVQTVFKTPALWFLLGLIITPFISIRFFNPEIEIHSSPLVLVIAGLLVGWGTQMGSGCTSGHGICGISRLSKRSLVATAMFMFAAMVTVYITRHVLGALA